MKFTNLRPSNGIIREHYEVSPDDVANVTTAELINFIQGKYLFLVGTDVINAHFRIKSVQFRSIQVTAISASIPVSVAGRKMFATFSSNKLVAEANFEGHPLSM